MSDQGWLDPQMTSALRADGRYRTLGGSGGAAAMFFSLGHVMVDSGSMCQQEAQGQFSPLSRLHPAPLPLVLLLIFQLSPLVTSAEETTGSWS